jgi:molecular chaperone DnaK (HSP70)
VAFDFGTSVSRIAFARGEGTAFVTDLAGDARIPSVLAVSPQGGLLAGLAARERQALFPRFTILSPKALLTQDAAALQKRGPFFPHTIVAGSPALLQLELGGRARSAIELSALFLAHLRRTAEVFLERPIGSGVFPVPVAFSPFDRRGYGLAARMAGFQQVRLIDETTAAALAWIAQGGRGRIGVCVWGAGYFSFAIVRVQDRLARVLASGGAAAGGDLLDHALAEDLLQRAKAGGPVRNEEHVARHLLGVAEAARRDLVARGKTEISVSLGDARPPLRCSLTGADLSHQLASLKAEAARVCRGVLADAGLQRGDLDALVLAGGLMRIPELEGYLSDFLGCKPVAAGTEPEERVAAGALERARMLDREKSDVVVLDASTCALGLEGQAGQVSPILGRSIHLPAGVRELFTTYLERQAEVAFELHGQSIGAWEPLARVEISDIPPMQAGAPSIEVLLVLDEDGQLTVEAQESTRSKRLGLEVRPARGLPASILQATLEALPAPPEAADFEAALREELRQRGRFLLDNLRELGRRQAATMTRDEKQIIAKKSAELEEVLGGADLVEIRSCAQELEEAARSLVQRDIDAGLQTVLR